ncbi:Curli production assembly/transport component CsgG [Psychroserpens sp. BH13MA-6]
MIAKHIRLFVMVVGCFMLQTTLQSQEHLTTPKTKFYDLRGTNAFDAALGTSVINGDYQDPMFEIYSHIGYKRHLTPHLSLDFGYHKFNLAYIDLYNEGFMSFDLNMELLLLPHHYVSPLIFVGAGYNAANHFKQTSPKLQAGLGVEVVLLRSIALKLYTDYNYVSSDTLDGLEAGASNDTYFRIALGLNFYFGGAETKSKLLSDYSTEIQANSITDDKN